MDRIDEILFLYEDDVVEMKDGGRIGFDKGGISLKEVNKYRKEGLRAADIIEKLDVGLSKYEEFLTKNKSKLVPVSAKKITDPERIKALDEAAKKYGYDSFDDVPTTKKEPGKRAYGDKEKITKLHQ